MYKYNVQVQCTSTMYKYKVQVQNIKNKINIKEI